VDHQGSEPGIIPGPRSASSPARQRNKFRHLRAGALEVRHGEERRPYEGKRRSELVAGMSFFNLATWFRIHRSVRDSFRPV
jgi:hypothetical protein